MSNVINVLVPASAGFYMAVSLIALIFLLVVMNDRMEDAGINKKWMFFVMIFIPVLNLFTLIYVGSKKSENVNRSV